MNQQNRSILGQPRNWVYFVFLGAILGFFLILIIFQVAGMGPIGNDASLSDFRVCLDDTQYNPVTEVLSGTKTIFVCGTIEGQGIVQGVLHVYLNNQMIQSKLFDHRAGTFYESLTFEKGITVGEYTINFFLAREIVNQTKFVVANSVLKTK